MVMPPGFSPLVPKVDVEDRITPHSYVSIANNNSSRDPGQLAKGLEEVREN